ncbi:hypothetical protein IAQ61_003524 [Plenodomus lingam]|uniref:uncharacterized protein n=1 Tax=Leptosphaeria maculans TaxID=5022 RepID=UPI003333770D|nr:hypothetical protein IAQ61_003524 [Plenodomus lingam]
MHELGQKCALSSLPDWDGPPIVVVLYALLVLVECKSPSVLAEDSAFTNPCAYGTGTYHELVHECHILSATGLLSSLDDRLLSLITHFYLANCPLSEMASDVHSPPPCAQTPPWHPGIGIPAAPVDSDDDMTCVPVPLQWQLWDLETSRSWPRSDEV